MEMDDRLSHLEQRVQLQEDEIQLLKAALADALRRLGYCEELTQASNRKGAPTKGQHSSQHWLFSFTCLGKPDTVTAIIMYFRPKEHILSFLILVAGVENTF